MTDMRSYENSPLFTSEDELGDYCQCCWKPSLIRFSFFYFPLPSQPTPKGLVGQFMKHEATDTRPTCLPTGPITLTPLVAHSSTF